MAPRSAAATVGTTVKTFLGLATYDSADSDWTFTTTTPLAAGFHTIEAYFAGDTTFAPSSGAATVTVVPQLLTHVVVTAGPNPSVYGATVTLTATVLAGYFGPVTTLPAGSVQFAYSPHGTALMVLLGSPVPLVNGQAVLKVPSATPAIGPLPVGIDNVTATYIPASSAFTGNTSLPFSEVILPVAGTVPTTTTVTPPSQTTAAGKEAGFTISVATPAAAPVSLTDPVYMFDLGSPILDPPGGTTAGNAGPGNPGTSVFLGTASYDSAGGDWTFTTTSPLSGGFHTIEAVFAGDSTYASSDGFATVTVVAPTPISSAASRRPGPRRPVCPDGGGVSSSNRRGQESMVSLPCLLLPESRVPSGSSAGRPLAWST